MFNGGVYAAVTVVLCDSAGSDDGDGGSPYDQSRPSFKATPKNVSVGLGQTAVLRCSVDNLGHRTVSISTYIHRVQQKAILLFVTSANISAMIIFIYHIMAAKEQ